jgi:RNA polymerase sigma factor (sigma-70 family)
MTKSTIAAISGGEPYSALGLTRAAANGDPSARKALIDRLFDRVRKTASYLAGSGADAEDIAQMSLVRILKSAGGFKGESSLEHWADRVTVHTAAKEFEKRERRARLLDAQWILPPPTFGVDEDTETRRIREKLTIAFGKLPMQNREAMVLHYFHGYDISEVAEIMQVSVNTARGRLRYGRKQLKRIVIADPLLKKWVEEQSI